MMAAVCGIDASGVVVWPRVAKGEDRPVVPTPAPGVRAC
jgi:hypothetical protein